MTSCHLCNTLSNAAKRTIVYETRYWRVMVAPNQSLLGRCYVMLQRHATSISELYLRESEDWLRVAKKVEYGIRAAFGAEMFNWQCNMNFVYREQLPNPHVHWYVMPRYRKPVVEFGGIYTDPDFGSLYQTREQEVTVDMLEAIALQIRSCIDKTSVQPNKPPTSRQRGRV